MLTDGGRRCADGGMSPAGDFASVPPDSTLHTTAESTVDAGIRALLPQLFWSSDQLRGRTHRDPLRPKSVGLTHRTEATVGRAGHHEQQVGQSIEIRNNLGVGQLADGRQANSASLRSTDGGPRDVEGCAGQRLAGETNSAGMGGRFQTVDSPSRDRHPSRPSPACAGVIVPRRVGMRGQLAPTTNTHAAGGC